MAFNNIEADRVVVANYAVWAGATELGFVVGDFDFDDGTGSIGVKAEQTGDMDIRKWNKTNNAKLKFKFITLEPERARMILSQYTLVTGSRGNGIRNNNRSALQLQERVITIVPNAVDRNGTEFNELNMHPKAIQFFRGVCVSGIKFKSSSDKAWEADLEFEALPDLSDVNFASFEQSPNVTLPAPSAMYVQMTNAGAGYTVAPTSVTCTGLTGSAFTTQIRPNGTLNVVMTNIGTALASARGTFLPLTITGGTSTTPATGQVYVG